MKYFLHRIQRANGAFTKGIEVHDTLDSAILSYWGRAKLAYGKTEHDFVSCMITDEAGSIVDPYNTTWLKIDAPRENAFFLHHIRLDGDIYGKDIDVLELEEIARGDLAVQMEYGYGNTRYPNVSFVHCMITDLLSGGMVFQNAAWVKPEPEPEPAAE